MLGLNKLPRHHHPIFESERFKGFSTDKFFISVEAADPKFDVSHDAPLPRGRCTRRTSSSWRKTT